MTPGAGTAHVVGRVACRRMRAGRRLIVVSRWLVCGVARGGAIYDARCRNGTCGRSRCVSADVGGASVERCFAVVVLWRSPWGAIHDARCRNGTCGRPRCVSADAGGAAVGLRFCGGWFAALRRSSGRHKWRPYVCGRLNAVLRRSVCGVARGGAIYDAR